MKDEQIDQEKTSITGAKERKRPTISFRVPSLSKPASKTHTNFNDIHKSGAKLFGAIIIVALLSGYGGAWLENHNQSGILSENLSSQQKIVTSQSQLISQINKAVGPSVVSVNVNINTSSSSSSGGGYGLFGYSQPGSQQAAAGTGIILSAAGLVITNRHVVPTGTTNVSITLSNGTELKDVSVLGRTSANDSLDIAFLKINNTQGQKLTPAVLGNSSTVQVGDQVVAIGNALGQFQNTITSGIISGYGRTVQATDGSGNYSSAENLVDLFQTDAAINQGNSGGPLVNMNGQIIGINTATAGNAQNIGFSIPINDAKGLIEQVAKTGKFSSPYIGIAYIPITADVANAYNLSVNNGAFIPPSSDPSTPSVIAGSPAATAGLQTNDIITQINSTHINQAHSLTSLIDQHIPGDHITLTVMRSGKTLHIDVILGSIPSS